MSLGFFEPIETNKIYAQVVNQILSLVSEGTLKAGDQLPPETQLAEQLGVSRSSVREALRALEILGVIASKTGVGSFVKGQPPMSILSSGLHDLMEEGSPSELLEARMIFEPEIVSLAAARINDSDLQLLKQNLRLMAEKVAKGEPTAAVDTDFHVLLASACGNPVLNDCMRLIADRMRRPFWQDMKRESLSVAGRPQTYLEHHRQILATVEKGDSQDAREAMQAHLKVVGAGLQEGAPTSRDWKP